MKPTVPILFAMLLLTPAGLCAQTGPTWRALVSIPGSYVAFDSARIERSESALRVWLRWDLAGGPLDFGIEYRIEQAEVDCARTRIRVLSRERMVVDGGRVTVTQPREATEEPWRSYPEGSVGGEVVAALCRSGMGGA
jgi:surface-adhesin protein E